MTLPCYVTYQGGSHDNTQEAMGLWIFIPRWETKVETIWSTAMDRSDFTQQVRRKRWRLGLDKMLLLSLTWVIHATFCPLLYSIYPQFWYFCCTGPWSTIAVINSAFSNSFIYLLCVYFLYSDYYAISMFLSFLLILWSCWLGFPYWFANHAFLVSLQITGFWNRSPEGSQT